MIFYNVKLHLKQDYNEILSPQSQLSKLATQIQ